MSDDGEEQLLHVFRRIDLHNNGKVRLEEIVPVAKDLGIRCSKNTLKKVFQRVDPDGVGTIDLEKFKTLYAQVSTPERVKALLPEASASFLDYRNSVEQDPSFAKHFPMPPSMSSAAKYVKHFNATVEALRWVADGTFLGATGEGKLLVYDVASRTDAPTKTCNVGPSVYCMDAVSGGPGALIGFGKKSDNLLLFNLAEESVVQRFEGQTSPIFSCCLGRSRGVALSGSKDGLIVMNDLETGTCLSAWQIHEGLVTSLTMKEDGHSVISTSRDGRAVVFDINSGAWPSCQVADFEDAAAGYTVCDAVWCGQDEILTAGDDYCVKRWDIREQREPPLGSYMGHTSCVRALALSPDGQMFASGANDSSVRLWALEPTAARGSLATTEDGEKVSDLLSELKVRREQVIELVHSGEGDPAEVRELNEEIEHLEAAAGGGAMDQEIMDAHGYIRAVLGLGGHSLTVGTLAWQDAGDGSHRLISGSQDEAVNLYEFTNEDFMSGLTQMSRQCSGP
mmetsp:Transcript_41210/g.95770  ORF Transcript_41210/g.95770 Transcript_41210/m.95770 type:complete len:509 (+) Transcript_41210:60-1586(+)